MKKIVASISLVGALTLLGGLFIESCGSKGGSSSAQLIPIQANVQQSANSTSLALTSLDEDKNMSLASAPTAQILLTGCASGRTLTCTSGSFSVYYADVGCVAQLQNFTSNGTTYNATSACNSISWKAGTACSFTSTGSSPQTVNVTVIQQLSNPTVTTDAVVFEWAQIQVGSQQLFTSNTLGFSAPDSIIVQTAPQFQISQLLYYGINSNGTGNFAFNLACIDQMTVDTANSTQGLTVCDAAKLSQLDYVLVAYPSTTITSTTNPSVLEALIAGGTDQTITWQGLTDTTNSDKLAAGKGGFHTKIMAGPGQISTASNMLLILRQTTTVGSATVKSYMTFQIQLQSLPGCSSSGSSSSSSSSGSGSCTD